MKKINYFEDVIYESPLTEGASIIDKSLRRMRSLYRLFRVSLIHLELPYSPLTTSRIDHRRRR